MSELGGALIPCLFLSASHSSGFLGYLDSLYDDVRVGNNE